MRVYNFSAGPSMLPKEVLEKARDELIDWQGSGMSVMEVSHRSKAFMRVAQEAEEDLRDLYNIPDHYHVCFMQGGGRAQFSMTPLNLLGDAKSADYVDTGIWSGVAIEEAKRYCDVNIVSSSSANHYTTIAPYDDWSLNEDSAYLHIVDNETINGLEFPDIPPFEDKPLVADMSSNILSRPIDVSRYGLIYAGAQKNIGPAGVTIAIIRDDLLGHARDITPTLYHYKTYTDSHSLYNTPPTFAWYMAGLTFKWIKEQGGLEVIAQRNEIKAKKLYDFIDASSFYNNPIDPKYRSRMNVIFTLKDDALNSVFLEKAEGSGLANLKGHRTVGGMRASIYNAMPEEGVDNLIAFMALFEKTSA